MSPPGGGAGTVREPRREGGGFPLHVLEAWTDRFPGLVAGITGAGSTPAGVPADFGLTTAPSPWALLERLEALGGQLDLPAVAVGRQVHGDAVTCLEPTPEGGVRVPGACDGLITGGVGLLLVVTAADCVPVHLLDAGGRGLGLLHAGWRGTAAGVLRSGVRAMGGRFGTDPARLLVHLGPAICGECYEVGPEVLRALGRPVPDADVPRLDLRGELRRRAVELGVPGDAVTSSAWCTRCDADQFHSHRGKGERAGRMAAFLGWQARAEVPGS